MFGRRKSAAQAADARSGDAQDGVVVDPGASAQIDANPEFAAEDGPFDRSAIKDIDAFYQGIGYGYLDLGALSLGIPAQGQLNAAVSPDGTPEFHIVTASCRVIPRAFAAPRTGGQWREWMGKIREQLQEQGADVHHEDGPWGRELVASQSGATFRLIGVEGPRWMIEARVVSTEEQSVQACDEAREIIGRLVVDRGSEPKPAGELLELQIPQEITDSLNQARAQLAQQAAANLQAQQTVSQGPVAQAQATDMPGDSTSTSPAGPVANGAAPAAKAQKEMRPRKRTSAMDRLRQMEADK